jgi:serine O-acetyltransferase
MEGSMFETYSGDLLRTYRFYAGERTWSLRAALSCAANPGVHAVTSYRLGHWLLRKSVFTKSSLTPLYLVATLFVRALWGIEISRNAVIGPGLYVAHFGAVTIGGGAVIGRNFDIASGVTIGASGYGEKRGTPAIGNNVYVATGAKLFGRISIGDNVKIGANAVVTQDVPNDAVVALSPGFTILSMKGNQSMHPLPSKWH